jgi:hypothetical protein
MADGGSTCPLRGKAVQLVTYQAQPGGGAAPRTHPAESLKRPNQTMAGSRVGLHDPPVYPTLSREVASIMAAAGPLRS